MTTRQTCIYEVLCDGKIQRTFSCRQTAITYLAAARDLCPGFSWAVREVVVTCHE